MPLPRHRASLRLLLKSRCRKLYPMSESSSYNARPKVLRIGPGKSGSRQLGETRPLLIFAQSDPAWRRSVYPSDGLRDKRPIERREAHVQKVRYVPGGTRLCRSTRGTSVQRVHRGMPLAGTVVPSPRLTHHVHAQPKTSHCPKPGHSTFNKYFPSATHSIHIT
jgi:hypothetical protein